MFVLIHSIWRWVVLLTALLAIVGAASARRSKPATWAASAGLWYTVSIDIQVLVGLILWLSQGAWAANPFIAFIHPLMMLAGVAVAHNARSRSKKGASTAAVINLYVGSLALLLLAMPTYSWGLKT